MYAIVDIETTGGFSSQNRMIEIAVVFHNGEQITGHYVKLLDPLCPIPGFITGLTGIDAKMLVGAPTFSEIAEELLTLLEDKVFVAHNVGFDFSFVKDAFQREGINYSPKRLCTVRMSRKIFPGLKSYSLGRLCESQGITVKDRHRALGDAWATAILFGKLIKTDQEGWIQNSLKGRKKELVLPPNISWDQFSKLPETTGVYYFHDMKGNVIYVGKAINIKSRFTGHFSGKSKINLKSEIHDVSFEETGSELLALMMEILEIKRLWPKYNRSLKVKSVSWGIIMYEDRMGYLRFQVGKTMKGMQPVFSFNQHAEAWRFITENVSKFQLCSKLSGIQKTPEACYDFRLGKCKGACCGMESPNEYNSRVDVFLKETKKLDNKVLIRDKGRNPEEESLLLFEQGFLSAFGFLDKNLPVSDEVELMNYLKPVKKIVETNFLLSSFIDKIPKSNIHFLGKGVF
ncbi:MAG: exonuclease domain-containing protein [Cyclobacteriaceae bacterium]